MIDDDLTPFDPLPALLPATPAPAGHGEPPVWIQVLGQVSVSGARGSVSLSGEGRTHVRSLIAAIAASRQGLPKEDLAEALWPRQTDRGARNRLYHTMHLARHLLGSIAWTDDWVTIDGGRVCLHPRIDGDALRVERAVALPPETLAEAELVQYFDWLQHAWAPGVDAAGIGHTIHEKLRSSRIALLREAARRHAAAGDTPERRELLDRLIELEPADERPQRELMQLDLEAGRWHQVLRRYDSARRALAHHLGVRPSRAMSELASQAAARLSDDPAPVTASTAGEPAATLLGREATLRELAEQLAAGPGVWNVHGVGGVGKTTLVLEAARRVAPRIDAGIARLSLEGSSSADIERELLIALEVDPEKGAVASDLLQSWLAMQPTLLVIDHFTPSPADPALEVLARLTAPPCATRVLLVTNAPLAGGREGWRSVAVTPLPVPEPGTPTAQIRHFPSVSLFCRRCAAVGVEPGVDFAWEEIADLVRRLDGLPLAIELAAAASVTMTPGEILQQLEDAGREGDDHAALLREPMQRSLELSFRLLDETSRRTLMACAVFEDQFSTEDAALLVRACGLATPGDVDALLQEVASAGLVNATGEGRWRILNLVRDHARARARKRGLWPRVEEARIDQLAELLWRRAASPEAPGYSAWMHQVAELHADALALLPAALRWRDARFLRLLVPLAHLWAQRGQSGLGLGWCDTGAAVAAEAGDALRQVELTTLAASLCIDSLHVQEALSRASAAVTLASELEFGAIPAQAVSVLSRAMVITQPAREAIALIRAWWSRYEGQPRECEGQATLLAAWINILFATKAPLGSNLAVPTFDFSRLRARLDGSLVWRQILKGMCAPRSPASALQRLELAEELRRLSGESQSHRMALTALNFKVQVLLELDRLDDAVAALQQQSAIAAQIGRHTSVVVAQISLAQISWYQGHVQEAQRRLDEAAQFIARHQSADLDAALRLHRTIVACLEGRTEVALTSFVGLERSVLVRCRLTLLHNATTAGALLAQLLGHEALAATLRRSLFRLLPDALLPPVAQRFRHLAFSETADDHSSDTEDLPDDDTELTQAALCQLYDALVDSHQGGARPRDVGQAEAA